MASAILGCDSPGELAAAVTCRRGQQQGCFLVFWQAAWRESAGCGGADCGFRKNLPFSTQSARDGKKSALEEVECADNPTCRAPTNQALHWSEGEIRHACYSDRLHFPDR